MEFYCLPLRVSVLMGPSLESVCNKYDKANWNLDTDPLVLQRVYIVKVVENRALYYEEKLQYRKILETLEYTRISI
jgi:hypothetical protein